MAEVVLKTNVVFQSFHFPRPLFLALGSLGMVVDQSYLASVETWDSVQIQGWTERAEALLVEAKG
jgi:hypothetical protein